MKGGKLKAMDRWRINSQNSEVVDKLCYIDIFLENTVRWSKQRTLSKGKGCQAFVTVGKCLSVTRNVNVHTLQVFCYGVLIEDVEVHVGVGRC